jgi:hypothetical protein
MSNEIDPKHPIENWRFEVVVDEQELFGLLNASGKLGVKNILTTLGNAVSNASNHIESKDFVLTEDGSLLSCRANALLPNYVLEIDLTEIGNMGPLARLDRELEARKGKGKISDWSVHGHLKDNPSYIDHLTLDRNGQFYLLNRSNSWSAVKEPLEPHLLH